MTVVGMLKRMSASEYAEWHEYYKLSPWGEERADLRAGIISSTVANVNRGKKGRTYKPSDFIPKHEDATSGSRPMTPEQSVKYMKYLAALSRLRERRKRAG